MSTQSERFRTPALYSEPLSVGEHTRNISLHDRLKSLQREEVFESNSGDQRLYVHLYSDTEERPVSGFGNSLASLSYDTPHDAPEFSISYFFDNNGKSIKRKTGKSQDSEFDPKFSRVDEGGYYDASDCIRLIELRIFKAVTTTIK